MEVRFGNYRIVSDPYNYMFQEFKGTYLDKEGKEKEKWLCWGYWGTLSSLVRALPDHVIRHSNGNLRQAVDEARNLSERLEAALRDAGYSG